ncbi:hypothetical protein OCA18_28180 [Bacillus cereus]|nr:hypothetical protein [Bacillus cereus]
MDKHCRKSSETGVFCNHEVFILGGNTKVKNVLKAPDVIYSGEGFTVDMDTTIQVSCLPESSGVVSIDTLDIIVNGSAKFTDFKVTEKQNCSNKHSQVTSSGLISRDGKAVTLIYDDFSVACDEQCLGVKSSISFFKLVADESNEVRIISFDVIIRGFASLDEGCGGQFNDNFETNVNIETILVDSKYPYCREN